MATRVQILAATVGAKPDNTLPLKMNLRTDAIIGNQCETNDVSTVMLDGNEIRYYSFAERGVGLNRNNALMRATGEFCLIADDDMRYYDGYAQITENAFDRHPDADVIIFNVRESRGKHFIIKKPFRVRKHNYMRFATFRFAVRTDSVKKRGISFNLSFGGGARYQHGEDSLFLADCLNKGLKIIAVPDEIGELLYDRESSWFKGFDRKYFEDQGALYAAISRNFYKFLCLQDVIRHRKKYKKHGNPAFNYKLMKNGAKEFLK